MVYCQGKCSAQTGYLVPQKLQFHAREHLVLKEDMLQVRHNELETDESLDGLFFVLIEPDGRRSGAFVGVDGRQRRGHLLITTVCSRSTASKSRR
jgi:hypothetical protein